MFGPVEGCWAHGGKVAKFLGVPFAARWVDSPRLPSIPQAEMTLLEIASPVFSCTGVSSHTLLTRSTALENRWRKPMPPAPWCAKQASRMCTARRACGPACFYAGRALSPVTPPRRRSAVANSNSPTSSHASCSARHAPALPARRGPHPRSARAWGPGCLQAGTSKGNPDVPTYQSEDCLQVNVFTPSVPPPEGSPPAPLPVMIFFHGGSFVEGSSFGPWYLYDGSIIADVGNVVVRESTTGVVFVETGPCLCLPPFHYSLGGPPLDFMLMRCQLPSHCPSRW